MKISFPVLLLVAGLWTSGTLLAAQMPAGPAQNPAAQTPPAQPPRRQRPCFPGFSFRSEGCAERYVVPSGTRLPLILHNAVTTRNAKPGDPVYLETLFPIVIDDRILIPAGSYVQGEIQEAKRPGKVKGTGEIRLRLNSMILPNGYAVDFNAVPTNAGTGGNESTDSEGNIHGDTDKGDDVGTVVKTTGIGAGIGAIATQRHGRGYRRRRRRGRRPRSRAAHARPRTGIAARHDGRRRPRSHRLSRRQPREFHRSGPRLDPARPGKSRTHAQQITF